MEANESQELQEHAEHAEHDQSLRPVALTMTLPASGSTSMSWESGGDVGTSVPPAYFAPPPIACAICTVVGW